jgi:hypothetical protein
MTRNNGKPTLAVADVRDSRSADITEEAAAAIVGSGQAMMRTQTEFSTAITVQRPRDRKQVQAAVLVEAELAGDDFFYSWTTKNKDNSRGLVEGLSIEGAMILARNWGNCAIPTELTVDAPTHWIIRATFVDLETGFNVPRLFRQRKSQSLGGKMDADRQMDIAFQIGQSKAQRNAIDKAMPNWLKEAALSKAKETSEGKFSNVAEANAKALAVYARIGVTQAQLEEKLGLKIEHWTARDHVSLSGLFRAIRDRQTTVAEEFPKGEAPAQEEKKDAPAAKSPYDDAVDRTTPAAAAPQSTTAPAAATSGPAPAAAGPVIPDLQTDTKPASASSGGMSAEDIEAARELDKGEPQRTTDAKKSPKA